jgi:hypothetical protein
MGISWHQIQSDDFDLPYSNTNKLSFGREGMILLCGKYLSYSTDEGISWSRAGGDAIINCKTASIDSAGNVFVGTSKGLYSAPSFDSAFVQDKDLHMDITALHTLPDGKIVVGTNNEGIFMAQGPEPPSHTSVATPETPAGFTVSPAFPNPFVGAVSLPFSLEGKSSVNLSIYNLLGRRVATLASATFNPGSYTLLWDGRSSEGLPLPPGSYYVRLVTPAGTKSVRVVKER